MEDMFCGNVQRIRIALRWGQVHIGTQKGTYIHGRAGVVDRKVVVEYILITSAIAGKVHIVLNFLHGGVGIGGHIGTLGFIFMGNPSQIDLRLYQPAKYLHILQATFRQDLPQQVAKIQEAAAHTAAKTGENMDADLGRGGSMEQIIDLVLQQTAQMIAVIVETIPGHLPDSAAGGVEQTGILKNFRIHPICGVWNGWMKYEKFGLRQRLHAGQKGFLRILFGEIRINTQKTDPVIHTRHVLARTDLPEDPGFYGAQAIDAGTAQTDQEHAFAAIHRGLQSGGEEAAAQPHIQFIKVKQNKILHK